jgi:hypothetical protein
VRATVVGYSFVALIALVLLGALVVVVRSFPDIRRYLRMRRM